MTGAVIGMGMISTEYLHIDTRNGCQAEIDHSTIDSLSSDRFFVSAQGFDNSDRDSEFTMKSNSRTSSHTSTTEPFVDGDGEEDNDDGKDAIPDAVHPNPKQLERRYTEPCAGSRKLRFSTLTIREYARVLGDNVTVMGPPISLSWEHQDETVYEIEDYEQAIQDSRRTQSELKMPSAHRDKILKESGYSRRDIQEAIKNSNITRNQRKRTIETLNLQPLQEAFEKAVKIRNPFRKKKSNALNRRSV